MVFLWQEINVSGGDDPHQLAAHLSGFCDGNPRETVPDFGLDNIPDCVVWAHNDWVCDETLLKSLKTNRADDA